MLKKLKSKLVKFIFRLLRDRIVFLLRAKSGFSWRKVNTVLEALGQDKIIAYKRVGKGIILYYKNMPKEGNVEKIR